MEVLCFLPSTHYPLYDFDLPATHARTLLPAALASVSFGFVLVRVRVRVINFKRDWGVLSNSASAVQRNDTKCLLGSLIRIKYFTYFYEPKSCQTSSRAHHQAPDKKEVAK